jgi:hypothetical protein
MASTLVCRLASSSADMTGGAGTGSTTGAGSGSGSGTGIDTGGAGSGSGGAGGLLAHPANMKTVTNATIKIRFIFINAS